MRVTITTGTGEYQGTTNVSLQKAVDAVASQGGGVVEVPAGIYKLRDALHLRSGVRVIGEPGTALVRETSVISPVASYLGYGFNEFTVADPDLFEVGMGVLVYDDNSVGFYQTVGTITERRGDRFYIDAPFNHDYHPTANAQVTSLFSLVYGRDIHDAAVEGIELDGNEAEERVLNGCRGGGVFLIGSSNVRIEGVDVHHYKSDAISFQQCVDITVRGCHLHHNYGVGLHPGSGTVRYVMERNDVHDNGADGVFYCLRTSHSRLIGNRLERNGRSGISIGESDTDHLIADNIIRDNGSGGVTFRKPTAQSGDRVRIEGNRIGNNCLVRGTHEIFIEAGLHDVQMKGNEIDPGNHGVLHVGADCTGIAVVHNVASGRALKAEAVGGEGAALANFDEAAYQPLAVGPEALPLNGALHLQRPELAPWVAV